MRLIRAHIENFKLLEDAQFHFSTDRERPLTVIRAENGSGKTSVLYALLWAFYGMNGLPKEARSLRLTSSDKPADVPVRVEVMLEFEHTDENEDVSRYRLIRSVTETPSATDKVERPTREAPATLLRITVQGEEKIPNAEGLIDQLIPNKLRDVFFTNGDDVQTFISGRDGNQSRQEKVHASIKLLLGLDALRQADTDLDVVFKRIRQDAAAAGGSDTSALERDLDKTDAELTGVREQIEENDTRLGNMRDQRDRWNKELTQLRGLGDLDELNERIRTAEAQRAAADVTRADVVNRMRDAFKAEECSWSLMREQLDKGFTILAGLADRNVIPGTSLQVLTDRLDLEECICGEPLTSGSEHRHRVEALRDEQRQIADNVQRLTQLFHLARASKATDDAQIQEGGSFPELRSTLQTQYSANADSMSAIARNIDLWKEQRKHIDDQRVRDLTDKISRIEAQFVVGLELAGKLRGRVEQLDLRRKDQDAALQDAVKLAKVSGSLVLRRDVAGDLLNLARQSLETLEGDYVKRVSDRMNQLFMTIVGSDPDFEAGVFAGVHIDDRYNLVVDTRRHGRSLDTDFELNGASQRALTLAYIWALMEVSAVTAPRIIDTPLGMVAGGVKTRMVDAITRPVAEGLAEFQVVLLLTRSEIRDIEQLLDERTGMSQTLSCSKDFPADLVYSWNVDHPTTRVCTCDHHQTCRICARRYDDAHGLQFRDVEAVATW